MHERKLQKHLAAPALQGYSIRAVDPLGHGQSEKPASFVYDTDGHARVLSQLIATNVPIVAHSIGGAVGRRLLLRNHGVSIQHFISVEGNPVPEDWGYASHQIAGQSFKEFANGGYEDFVRSLESSDRSDLRTWARWLRDASLKPFTMGANSLVESSDIEPLLASFNGLTKKTYIHGGEDDKHFLLPLEITSVAAACRPTAQKGGLGVGLSQPLTCSQFP